MQIKTGATIEELAAIIIADIRKWTPDEKAHLRAKLRREFFPKAERQKIAYKI